MRRSTPLVLLAFLALAGQASPAAARIVSRSYLAFAGGLRTLTADVSGDVIDERLTGHLELGVGYQLGKRSLLEFTYGWNGTFTQDPLPPPLDLGELPSDAERAYQVAINAMFLRWRFAPSGIRTEYLKTEWSAAVGFMQVSRLLRNVYFVPPEETSQMLPALEVGLSGLVVFSDNFMGTFGGRYTITQRSDIVDDTNHLDGFAFLIGMRVFLPSPRDAATP